MTNEVATKYALSENLFYFEVSALKNDGINKMMYTVFAELNIFSDYELSKEKLIDELEQTNATNLNISVLTGINNLENHNIIENKNSNNNLNNQQNETNKPKQINIDNKNIKPNANKCKC